MQYMILQIWRRSLTLLSHHILTAGLGMVTATYGRRLTSCIDQRICRAKVTGPRYQKRTQNSKNIEAFLYDGDDVHEEDFVDE